jgi:hypothetical protein
LKVRRRGLAEFEATASRVAYGGAVLSVGLMAWILSHGIGYLVAMIDVTGGGVALRGSTLLFYGLIYIFVVYPLFGPRSVWVLGAMWGLSEVNWNIQAAIGNLRVLSVNFPSVMWDAYIVFVSVLFLLSLYQLRKSLALDKFSMPFLLSLVLYPSLVVPQEFTKTAVGWAQVTTWEWPYHALVISSALLLCRRARKGQA